MGRINACAIEQVVERGGVHTVVGVQWKSILLVSGFRKINNNNNNFMTRSNEVFVSETGVVHGVHCIIREGRSVLLWSPAVTLFAAALSGWGLVFAVTSGAIIRRVTS